MKVGSDAADRLKKQSELQQIPFANLLWIYMAEDMMQRFYQSSYKEILWLENDEFLEERERGNHGQHRKHKRGVTHLFDA